MIRTTDETIIKYADITTIDGKVSITEGEYFIREKDPTTAVKNFRKVKGFEHCAIMCVITEKAVYFMDDDFFFTHATKLEGEARDKYLKQINN